ncbi:hypothetical protein [Thermococcus sp.]|uniref:hypothetical protein n=1 Tax=Thermococcus sp. TaxID=35749 RepID=UPI0025ECB7E3|nr:hypothetical protein [Thermococcus sp.]
MNPRVLTIKPLQEKPPGDVRDIYYPMWIYVFEYLVKRKVFGDIRGRLIVLVDGINSRAYLADLFPELEEVGARGRILEPEISDAEGEDLARDKAETFLFRKFAYLRFTYWMSEKAFAYKVFWAKKLDGSYLLIDSITGDEIEVQKIRESEEAIDDPG